MSYQDISPPQQNFMNFSRPLSLQLAPDSVRAEWVITLIYGFGEYRFRASDSPEIFRALENLRGRLAGGSDTGEIRFLHIIQTADKSVSGYSLVGLTLKGGGEILTFSLTNRDDMTAPGNIADTPGEVWLTGEVSRTHLIAVTDELLEYKNNNQYGNTAKP